MARLIPVLLFLIAIYTALRQPINEWIAEQIRANTRAKREKRGAKRDDAGDSSAG